MELTGKTLGAYEVRELIGRGGMAAVYRAHQPSTGRDVAMKVILPDYAEDETFSKRFEREAKALASLQHIHILPVFDYGEQAGVRYLVMPLLSGKSLADRLRDGRLETREASRLFRQMSSALDYAHSKGMLHRDIKPGNVLLDDVGNALLADFGLIRMMNSDDRSRLTSDSRVVGTPAYMSPEQGQGQNLDHRSDLYSLGIMLYEMLTGNVPYRADTPVAVIFKHITEPLPRVDIHRTDLPRVVDDVLAKALAKNSEDRYQSGMAMAEALDAALLGKTIADPATLNVQVKQPHMQIPMTPIGVRVAAEDHPTAIGEQPLTPMTDAHTALLPNDKRKREQTLVTPMWRNMGILAAVIVGVLAVGFGIFFQPMSMAVPPPPTEDPPSLLIPLEAEITSMMYNSDGTHLLVGTEDNAAYVFDTSTGEEFAHLEAHSGDVLSIAIAPSGEEIITGGADNTFYRWETRNGTVKITGMEGGPVRAVDYGNTYYAYATNANVAWGTPGGMFGTSFYKLSPTAANVLALALNDSETLLATGDEAGYLQFWNPKTGEVVDTHQAKELPLVALAFMPDSDFVLAGYEDGTVILYSTIDGEEQTYTTGQELAALAVYPDGAKFATAHGNGGSRIWDTATGETLATYQEQSESVRTIAFSPDGAHVAYGGAAEKIWIRELR
jgi:serine/threonine protein kinase/WD40 repeat protein